MDSEYVTPAEYSVVNGDVTRPINEGSRSIIIPHIVNDAGRWESDVANAITKRLGELPRQYYREWFEGHTLTDVPVEFFSEKFDTFELGRVQYIQVPNHSLIANMVAQSSIKEESNGNPIRHEALVDCMKHVRKVAKALNADIDVPKFGLARTDDHWDFIEELIWEMWVNRGIDVIIYEYP
jgi:hypothetical protein